MTICHSVEHQGFRFTRNSKGRSYSHAVLVPRSVAADRANAEESARFNWNQNRAYRQQQADGRCPNAARFPSQYTPAEIAQDTANAKAWLALGVEGHVAEALAAFDRRSAGWQVLADGDTYFMCAGWCGRLDLAQKLASSSGGFVVAAVQA